MVQTSADEQSVGAFAQGSDLPFPFRMPPTYTNTKSKAYKNGENKNNNADEPHNGVTFTTFKISGCCHCRLI
jgi:hypothetical protein